MCFCVSLSGVHTWAQIRCIATDGAGCFLEPLSLLLPKMPHLRCRWHLYTNINKNVRTTMGNDWHPFVTSYFTCVNAITVASFEQAWESMIKAHPKAASYMNSYHWPCRTQWASCWTDEYATLGAHSTQRVESINSLIKQVIRPSAPLIELFKTIDQLSMGQQSQLQHRLENDRWIDHDFDSRVYTTARLHLTRQASALLHAESVSKEDYDVEPYSKKPSQSWKKKGGYTCVINSIIVPVKKPSITDIIDQSISSSISSQLIDSSINCAINSASIDSDIDSSTASDKTTGGYVVKDRRSNDTIPHWVTVTPDEASCSDCHFAGKYLLPCRHIMAANLMAFGTAFQAGQCHPRWSLDAMETATLSSSHYRPSPVDISSLSLSLGQLPTINPGQYVLKLSDDSRYVNLKAAFDRMAILMQSAPIEDWQEVKKLMENVGASWATKVRSLLLSHFR
jgi:hypothetical protein